jgi:hypothetical protein
MLPCAIPYLAPLVHSCVCVVVVGGGAIKVVCCAPGVALAGGGLPPAPRPPPPAALPLHPSRPPRFLPLLLLALPHQALRVYRAKQLAERESRDEAARCADAHRAAEKALLAAAAAELEMRREKELRIAAEKKAAAAMQERLRVEEMLGRRMK